MRKFPDASSSQHNLINFTSGLIAGIVSKAATMPLDVIKKRLQVQCPERASFLVQSSAYGGVCDVIRRIFNTEGFRGFFKGLPISLIKSAPATAISFVTFYFIDK